MNETATTNAAGGMVYGFGPGGFLFIAAILVVTVFTFWRIFAKAGYSGAWGLFAVFPLAQIVLLLFLALATWPRERTDI